MKAASKRSFSIITAAIFALGVYSARGAKAPIDAENREKQASNVVTGKVVSVTSKVKKSSVEKAKGLRRDKVFLIKVKVGAVAKGKGIKPGDEIQVIAWRAHTRIPPLPGLQGHEPIPEKGDVATFYLKEKGKSFEPLMPNGIDIDRQEMKKGDLCGGLHGHPLSARSEEE